MNANPHTNLNTNQHYRRIGDNDANNDVVISNINDSYLDELLCAQSHSQSHSVDTLRGSRSAVLIPDSEFSPNELPLRTDTSEFFIIDGVAIHYCLETNNVSENDRRPWIVLLHGFGGGIFSWKRSIPLLLSKLDDDDIAGILAFDRVGFGLTERPVDHDDIEAKDSE
eukprot:342142_1